MDDGLGSLGEMTEWSIRLTKPSVRPPGVARQYRAHEQLEPIDLFIRSGFNRCRSTTRLHRIREAATVTTRLLPGRFLALGGPNLRFSATARFVSVPLPNRRLKLTARVNCGMNVSSARRSLSAIR